MTTQRQNNNSSRLLATCAQPETPISRQTGPGKKCVGSFVNERPRAVRVIFNRLVFFLHFLNGRFVRTVTRRLVSFGTRTFSNHSKSVRKLCSKRRSLNGSPETVSWEVRLPYTEYSSPSNDRRRYLITFFCTDSCLRIWHPKTTRTDETRRGGGRLLEYEP